MIAMRRVRLSFGDGLIAEEVSDLREVWMKHADQDEIYDRRPGNSDLLIATIDTHQARLGRTPRLVAADAAFYSTKNEAAAKAKGVNASASQIALPKMRNANASRRSGGSAMVRNGGPDARVASAWSSDGMGSIAAATRAMLE